jgi:hypothetical protein
MKLFTCSGCNNLLYFENTICLNCARTVGFDPSTLSLVTLEQNGGYFSDLLQPDHHHVFCGNAVYGACNWLVGINSGSAFCIACNLNRTIPDLNNEQNLQRWKSIEVAKHRLVYSLLKLRLPFADTNEFDPEVLAFDFVADVVPGKRILTGHDNGLITLNIEEADDAVRVRNRLSLGEGYRTLLGHFRHETGHFYWDLLVRGSDVLQGFRNLFGNEALDYAKALENYYASGAPADWSFNYISPYATSHPWEDWAETWAHYLHMMDTLETAFSFGMRIKPKEVAEDSVNASIRRDPYQVKDFDEIVQMWLPLCYAVNSLNRSMGHADFYPFVISKPVAEKLKFIHQLVSSKQ